MLSSVFNPSFVVKIKLVFQFRFLVKVDLGRNRFAPLKSVPGVYVKFA